MTRGPHHAMPQPLRVELGGQTIQALSVGGIETCFQLSGFDCNLDIGRCPPGAIGMSRLLLTHAHMDHAAGLPYYVSMRAMQRLPAPRIYCPAEVRAHLQEILDGWARLDSDADRCSLVGVKPGDPIPLGGGRHAVAFRAPHRVAAVGYLLYSSRRKLKPELRGLDGPRLGALRRAGQPLHDVKESLELCFCGDTSAEVIDLVPEVTQARLLLLECTFIGDRPGRTWAGRGGHVHLDDIADRADRFENEAIVLTHFSRRYPPEDIIASVRRRLPAALRERVHLLLEDAVVSRLE